MPYGNDRALVRRILDEALAAEVGEYSRGAVEEWKTLVTKYRIENATVEPMVTLVANDNWMEYTVRYVVDYRRRRTTKAALFNRILDAVDASSVQVQLASAAFELVAMPPVKLVAGTDEAK